MHNTEANQSKKVFFDDVVGRFVDKCVMADPAQEDLWQHSQAQQ